MAVEKKVDNNKKQISKPACGKQSVHWVKRCEAMRDDAIPGDAMRCEVDTRCEAIDPADCVLWSVVVWWCLLQQRYF